MKIILYKTTEIEKKHENSLSIAKQFFAGAQLFSNYLIPSINTEHIEDPFEFIKDLDENILFATSSTVFTAECFLDCMGAFDHFNQTLNGVILQLTFDNEHLMYPSPTLLYYGGRRLWSTSTKITSEFPILYGNSKLIYKILTKEKELLFNDGIFKGGSTTVLSPIPPLAFNLEKELPAPVSSAAFDAKSYIESIPELNFTKNDESLPSAD